MPDRMKPIDLTSQTITATFAHNFNKVVGSGHLGLALYERTLRHLEMAHDELGMRYLRCHGLLSGSPDLCTWADQGQAVMKPDLGFDSDQYSGSGDILHCFAFIDLIIDRLLDIGIRPFVEIGFMPRILASDSNTLMRWDAHTCPPRDYKLWSELIESLARHWRKRYGLNEISQWYFEVWNEPNLDGFWSGDMPEYFKLYEHTARAVKSVDQSLPVGGPATAGRHNSHIPEFLDYCHKNNVPVDFVTSHSYPVRNMERDGEFAYPQLFEPAFLANRFGEMRDEIQASPFADLPLHITEYNSATSQRNIIHDLPFNAAYLARALSEAGQHADSFSYWAVSDIFVEETITPAEFSGGYGLINIHDIPKPTYHLFQFFSQLGHDELSRGADHLFTKRDDGHVVGVIWNPNDTSRDSQRQQYRIVLPDAAANYTARLLLVDEDNGNPYQTWQMLGRERHPARETVELIRESARPLCQYTTPVKRDGKTCIEASLDKNAIMLVDLIPIEDHTPQYHGLNKQAYQELSV